MDEVDSAETAIRSKEIFDATVSILGLFTLLLMFMFKLHACQRKSLRSWKHKNILCYILLSQDYFDTQ